MWWYWLHVMWFILVSIVKANHFIWWDLDILDRIRRDLERKLVKTHLSTYHHHESASCWSFLSSINITLNQSTWLWNLGIKLHIRFNFQTAPPTANNSIMLKKYSFGRFYQIETFTNLWCQYKVQLLWLCVEDILKMFL